MVRFHSCVHTTSIVMFHFKTFTTSPHPGMRVNAPIPISALSESHRLHNISLLAFNIAYRLGMRLVCYFDQCRHALISRRYNKTLSCARNNLAAAGLPWRLSCPRYRILESNPLRLAWVQLFGLHQPRARSI